MVTLTIKFHTRTKEKALAVGKDIVNKIPEITQFVISEVDDEF